MNTMQEALSKAGVNVEDFKDNEPSAFSAFPFITKWREILPDREAYMEQTYKYQQPYKSKLVQVWTEKQDPSIIGFLKKHKERVYVFPSESCKKFLEAWIGYSSKYQRFVIRINPIAQLVHPWSTPANSYAMNFVKAAYDILKLNPVNGYLDSISFTRLLNMIGPDQMPHVIRKTFREGIIPIERFDPIIETNSLITSSMIVAESTNLNDIREQLGQLEESDQVLSSTKLHKNVVDLYCRFNNISAIDPDQVSKNRSWINLILAKDTSTHNSGKNGKKKKKNKKERDKSFFIIM